MSRKDYVNAIETIREMYLEDISVVNVLEFCRRFFESNNPRYDHDKFMAAYAEAVNKALVKK